MIRTARVAVVTRLEGVEEFSDAWRRYEDRGVRASVVVTDLCHQASASSEAWVGRAPGTVAPLAMIITLAIPWVVSQVPSTSSASSAARVSCPGAQEKDGRPAIWILLLVKAAAR